MAKNGQNLRVFIGGKCVAVSTSCSFHVAIKTEESSTKDTVGDYDELDVTGKSWDVSCETLYDPENTSEGNASTSTGITPAELMAKIILQPKPVVELMWTSADGAQNRVAHEEYGYSGTAILSDASVNSPNRQKNTSTFQFTGTGPLKSAES